MVLLPSPNQNDDAAGQRVLERERAKRPGRAVALPACLRARYKWYLIRLNCCNPDPGRASKRFLHCRPVRFRVACGPGENGTRFDRISRNARAGCSRALKGPHTPAHTESTQLACVLLPNRPGITSHCSSSRESVYCGQHPSTSSAFWRTADARSKL